MSILDRPTLVRSTHPTMTTVFVRCCRAARKNASSCANRFEGARTSQTTFSVRVFIPTKYLNQPLHESQRSSAFLRPGSISRTAETPPRRARRELHRGEARQELRGFTPQTIKKVPRHLRTIFWSSSYQRSDPGCTGPFRLIRGSAENLGTSARVGITRLVARHVGSDILAESRVRAIPELRFGPW